MSMTMSGYKLVANISLVFVALLSLLILIIWQFDFVNIKNIFPSQQISNPVTALCLLSCSLSIYFAGRMERGWNLFGQVLAFCVLVIAAIVFFSIFFNYSTVIDKWLYTEKLLQYGHNGLPNYMAPNTALNFFIAGISLLLIHPSRSYRIHLVSDAFALAAMLISFVSMVGYFYQSPEFYGLKSYIPMAFPTAASFFLLSAAILFQGCDHGIFSAFTGPYSGSKAARFLIPFAIAVPVIVGKLDLYGEQLGWYSAHFGAALSTTSNIMIFIFLIYRCSLFLNKSNIELEEEIAERKRLNNQISSFNKSLEKKVEERTRQIEKNEKLFRSMIENSIDVVCMVDDNNLITYVSPSIEKIIGIGPNQVIGTRGRDFVHPDSNIDVIQLNKAVMDRPGEILPLTLKLLHSDGHYIQVEGTIVNLLNNENVKGIVTNFHDITSSVKNKEEKRKLEQKLVEERLSHQKRLLQASMDGQEKEKKQMGMELHDNINQLLSTSKLYLEIGAADENMKDEMLGKSKELIMHVINEIRNLSKTLVPHGIGSEDISEGIEGIIETVESTTRLKINSSISREVVKVLDSKQQIAIYRIIQEQLNNIIKHANASHVSIGLWTESHIVELQICDDGKGFDTKSKRAGIGLSNISSRTDLLDGEMEIESAIDHGCKLKIRFPMQQLSSMAKL